MLRTVIALLIIVIFASPASGAGVNLYAEAAGADCALGYNAPGVTNIYAVLFAGPGATAAQFSAPLPNCWPGVVYLADYVPPPFISIGNSQTGISIALGSCALGGMVHILTIQVFAAGASLIGDCCHYWVQADPTTTPPDIYIADCDNPPNLLTGYGGDAFVTRSGGWEPPELSNPLPQNGSSDQPLDVNLEWDVTQCSCGLGVMTYDVYFGTAPDPPRVAQWLEFNTYSPGILQPATTYYWKIVATDTDAGTTTGPVWSFTTESAIPTEKSSWGRIKSLYK